MLRSLAIRGAEELVRLAGGGQRLLVLIYHRVLPRPDPMYPYDPDAGAFRRQMETLAEDFRVLPLAEALRLQQQGRLPAHAIAITFDDGFADNVTQALPVLRALDLSATFFIATGYLGGGFMFNDAIIEACRQAPGGVWATGDARFGDVRVDSWESRYQAALAMIENLKYEDAGLRAESARGLLESAGAQMPPGLMMTHAQLRELRAAGMDIGGHTRSHPILARIEESSAELEIAGGRSDLVDISGGPVDLFAYPNGRPGRDYGPRDVALVRRLGFRAAVSTAWGFADRRSDPLQIPRVGSWGDSMWRFSGRLALARARSRGASCTEPVAAADG